MKTQFALVLLVSLAFGPCTTFARDKDWAKDYLPEVYKLTAKSRREAAIAANPDWKESEKKAVLEGSIHKGMSKAQVLASWGKPARRNVSAGRTYREQWVYDGPQYLYFSGDYGELTSWQSSER